MSDPAPPKGSAPVPALGESSAVMRRQRIEQRREDLFHRIQWLLFFRLALAVTGVILTLVGEGGGVRQRAPYAIFILACVLDTVYLGIAPRMRNLRRFAAAQIAVDGLLEAALSYLTGGVYSSFSTILFVGSILAAALCVSARMSVIFASGASAALAVIQIAYKAKTALPFVPPAVLLEHSLRTEQVAVALVSQAFALHLVAGLSSWLALQLSRERFLYREILEKMAEGLVALDASGRIMFVNGEALRLFQYNARAVDLVGRDFRDVFKRKEDRSILNHLLLEQPVTVELLVSVRGGGTRSVEVRTSVLRDDAGVSRGTIGIFADLTLKKQAEDAERRAERLEEVEALAMGIAHEVRNPLASIRGCVQELGRVNYLSDDERALARIVCRESDRLDSIVGEFLRFARLKPPELRDLDLGNLLREVVVLLKGRLGSGSGVRIELDLIENARASADAQQLIQVFLNLGINALESMEDKAGALTVRLRDVLGVRHASTPRGGFRVLEGVRTWEVSFEDDGSGIAAADMKRLFEPFFTTKPGGTGLGLALAERVVKQHGGTITAEARLEGGTVFRVRLPAAERVPAPAP